MLKHLWTTPRTHFLVMQSSMYAYVYASTTKNTLFSHPHPYLTFLKNGRMERNTKDGAALWLQFYHRAKNMFRRTGVPCRIGSLLITSWAYIPMSGYCLGFLLRPTHLPSYRRYQPQTLEAPQNINTCKQLNSTWCKTQSCGLWRLTASLSTFPQSSFCWSLATLFRLFW